MVENSFNPFHGKVISDDPGFEMLESRIFLSHPGGDY